MLTSVCVQVCKTTFIAHLNIGSFGAAVMHVSLIAGGRVCVVYSSCSVITYAFDSVNDLVNMGVKKNSQKNMCLSINLKLFPQTLIIVMSQVSYSIH